MASRAPVSIKDVAKRAKVSITTVSRVINKATTVSPENVSRVEEAIAALKFRPNVSAQRLANGANNTVGLVIPGYPGIFYSFFGIETIRGAGHACESTHYDMVLHISSNDLPLNLGYLGGIIFADIIGNRKQLEAAVADGIPCVIINHDAADLNTNYITVDNVEGGRIAAEYLTSLGHRCIATVTGNLATQAGAERCAGFLKELDRLGVSLPDGYLYKGDYSRRSARLAAEQFLSLAVPPTAVFAQSDDMAQEVIAVATEKGISVPDQLSVIGFDDSLQALYGHIGLTTIRQPIFEMAETAVKILQEVIQGQRTETFAKVLVPRLVLRESCVRPPSASAGRI